MDNFINAGFIDSFREFNKERWVRLTKMGLGAGLTMTAMVGAAVASLPVTVGAIVGRMLLSGVSTAATSHQIQENIDLHRATSTQTKLGMWDRVKGFFNKKNMVDL